MTLGEVAQIVGGTLNADADPTALVTAGVEYDSRKVGEGSLFLAIAGEHVDGHDFVGAAHARGAVAALVTHDVDGPAIVIDDPQAAIAALAMAVARRLNAITIAITGSSGKTSSKDLLAQVLQVRGTTVAPAGNFNNELGHPYTVLQAGETTEFLVLETGARGIGHIRYLTEIAPPRIGVVMNVGSAHIGEFGSREAIAQAKGELVESLPAAVDGGVAVLNLDDPAVSAMAARTKARIVSFGESAGADVRAVEIVLDDFGRAGFTIVAGPHEARVQLRLIGEHHVSNALAAAAVALQCGLDIHEIAAALSSATARSRWRMELTERADGVVIINDAYNANPESMRAALKALAYVGRARAASTWAVLGPMGELGEDSQAEHDALGRLAVRLDISHLLAVGELAKPIAHGGSLEGSWNGESGWVADVDAAVAELRARIRPGDILLVKASRSAGLERIAVALGEDVSDGRAEGVEL
ncbi:UDP-N-acetylmuramoyl-tripeptide--D-alanyl-D-alanine ligase [Jatrophihabitans sp. GAS493]|nr:UDP-N-acetylmuramoyl-tripeptide--D-alanyl-D-alanine ligase [Jatrophihabitans sp. GAS493]SOD74330.1 UDP-N-acetylmuramoyl-tripeptide--D-alanyl-D-alanine ligase [Jatrophihabitans sp. GAS493]